jgi:hypothetical protein
MDVDEAADKFRINGIAIATALCTALLLGIMQVPGWFIVIASCGLQLAVRQLMWNDRQNKKR